MTSNDQLVHWLVAILAFISSGLCLYAFRMILALNDRQTVSEEKARNHTSEIERRFIDGRSEMERRFQDKRDDLVGEKLMFDLKIKSITDNHEQQTSYLKQELNKIEVSMIALHRRLDEFLNNKA